MSHELYRHDDYRVYIRAWLEAHPKRSQRWLAGQLGVSPGHISMVLSAQRDLGLHHAQPLGRILGHEGDALRYFDALVRAEHAPSLDLRRAARHHLRATQSFMGLQAPLKSQYAWYGSWVHLAILGLATMDGFRADASWICTRLWPAVEAEPVESALRELVDGGVLLQDDDAGWRADTSLRGTGRSVHDRDLARAVHRLHADQLDHAGRAIEQFGADKRVVASVSLPVADGQMPALVSALNRFHIEVVEPFRGQRGGQLVEVMVVLFPRSVAP